VKTLYSLKMLVAIDKTTLL